MVLMMSMLAIILGNICLIMATLTEVFLQPDAFKQMSKKNTAISWKKGPASESRIDPR